jgi:hypothetical protein
VGGDALTIRPTWGGPGLKKNGRLSWVDRQLVVTDRRGRTRTFDLSGPEGPYRFIHGDGWKGEANYALINGSGYAEVLFDLKAFRYTQIDEIEGATGLSSELTANQPPSGRDSLLLTNPPYIKWGMTAFYPGVAAFGLWSISHWTPFILGVVVALAVMLPLLLLAKMAAPSRAEIAAEARQILPKLEQAKAMADEWMAQYGDDAARASEERTQRGGLIKEPDQEHDPGGH